MKTLKSLLEKINIAYIQLVDCEADDIIASFVSQTIKNHPNTNFDIFTRDKDLLQLLNTNTNILKYINGKISLYTQSHFFHEYNFSPKNYVDYLSLLGDNVDNIEGIKGVGPVSAKKIIQQFQTIENIYQKIDNLPNNTKKLIENKKALVYCNKKIISLEKNISLPIETYKSCNFN